MSKHQTQWAAQFAVASELCKRGYDVAFTMGNQTPDADILAIGPTSKQAIKIDVKGQSSKNFWRIREKEEKPGLFYILTLVRLGQETEFFIMTETDVRREQQAYRMSGVKYDERFAGFNWGTCKPYKDAGDRLPT